MDCKMGPDWEVAPTQQVPGSGQATNWLVKMIQGGSQRFEDQDAVGHSYASWWEVVVNQLACIELLHPSRYFGRTFDSMGPLFTGVQFASCKAVDSDANET